MKYLIFVVLFAFIAVSCDDSSTDNPPVKKVETELLGSWKGMVKQNSDSVAFSVTFADSESGPVVNGKMYAKIITNNGSSTKTVTQEGTIYYTFNKPSIIIRFFADSNTNGFVGVLSADGKTMVGEVEPNDFLTGSLGKYIVTLTKE